MECLIFVFLYLVRLPTCETLRCMTRKLNEMDKFDPNPVARKRLHDTDHRCSGSFLK